MEYILMHKNIPVAELQIDNETCYIIKISKLLSEEHIPIGIKVHKGAVEKSELNTWWLSRSIPASRVGLQNALELLKITTQQSLLSKCFGLSLSDQYWVCPANSKITWDKVNFFENSFSDDVGTALFGSAPNSKEISLVSPDNTSDGWLKKKWIIKDGKRFLIKGGSNPYQQEPLNEVLACEIMKCMNIPHVPYSLMWENDVPYSVCEDFITTETELISANYIMQVIKKENHISPFEHFMLCCEKLGIPNVSRSISEMLFVDGVIANSDRHFGNFGAVRNAETLEWIGMSPVYDSGTSMFHDLLTNRIKNKFNTDSKPFRSHHSEQLEFISDIKLNISALNGIVEFYNNILQKSPFIDDERRHALCDMLDYRIRFMYENLLK